MSPSQTLDCKRIEEGCQNASAVCDNLFRTARKSLILNGEMSEWLKEHAWKACVGETLPWVRIPLSPPSKCFRVNHLQGANVIAATVGCGTRPCTFLDL